MNYLKNKLVEGFVYLAMLIAVLIMGDDNMTLEHQKLVHELNKRAAIKAENERMKELEQVSTPFFYMFIIVLGLLGLAGMLIG